MSRNKFKVTNKNNLLILKLSNEKKIKKNKI